ncbi:MAG: hypothetical protein CVT49_14705 [candidate division Zixibacteria bacterium HGW-Zixibacteria-1]|nr:MAG: hypothetical protein CVT49_14705 [candidate division Zixibacteria bacterium HGW-Zixibacteria-1]
MIYEFPDLSEPLRQGDIFIRLPRIEISLKEILLAEEFGPRLISWDKIASTSEPISLILQVRPVIGIVASQDCDARRSRDITLCEIRDFKQVEGKCKDTSSSKSWKTIITQHARINQKWFYLPPDEKAGLLDKMAVDFMVTLRIPREDLEAMRSLRKARLNKIARDHFRERISEFFRRYSYNEWYALNKEELNAYLSEYPDTTPYEWQKRESN